MQFLLISARSLSFPNFFNLCMLLKPLSDCPAPIFFFFFFFTVSSLLRSSSRLFSASMSSYVVSEKGSPFALDGLGGKSDHWAPYVHPLVRLSANSLSQMSLEMCTESLGSETGSDEIFSFEDSDDHSVWASSSDDEDYLMEKSTETCDVTKSEVNRKDEKAAAAKPPRRTPASVNYHCSSGRSTPRSFPPPLPSICRRDGRCVSMRRRRLDGRLVVEAVPARSQNYLHAQRLNGRLLLTFIDSAAEDIYPGGILRAEAEGLSPPEQVYEDDSEVAEEEEEEVEVVDRGIVVEVKVSRPQMLPQSGGGLKVQLSSVVINKFVGMPLEDEDRWIEEVGRASTATTATTATAVVAVAAAASSSLSADEGYWKGQLGPQSRPSSPEKVWFTSKGTMNRGDLLHQVRRCSELRRPLFIWEPCCVASS